MKHAKKILLIIAIITVVMTTGIQVAFGEPTPSTTVSASPSPSPSPSQSPTQSVSPETSETESPVQTTFELMDINTVSENVIRLQMRLRDLGYFNYRATGMYYSLTQKAVKTYQEQNELSPDGQAGEITYNDMFTIDAARKQLSSAALATIESGPGPSLDTYAHGELSSWDEINAIFAVGDTVTVTDFNTGATFQLTRTGGENHANVEAPNSESNTAFVDCFEGKNNWSEKRAVLVTIGGVQYAASLFGHPSGEDTISDNGMEGHTDLYFNGSTSDVLGFADKKHQERVLIAAGEIEPY